MILRYVDFIILIFFFFFSFCDGPKCLLFFLADLEAASEKGTKVI